MPVTPVGFCRSGRRTGSKVMAGVCIFTVYITIGLLALFTVNTIHSVHFNDF